MNQDLFVIIVVATALVFDIVNGFHDAANSIATVVSTQVLKPYQAVIWAAFFNFAAFLIFAPKVASTISKIVKIDSVDPVYTHIVFSGIIGAILWDLITWRMGLPTSSSHALIGGFAGAGIMHGGFEAIRWEMLLNTALFIVIAPLLGFFLGMGLMIVLFWFFRQARPLKVDRFFRKGQLLSAALYSIGHGANDAQKTMGMIMALLIAHGTISQETPLSLSNPHTSWVILSCHAAMAFGTLLGGWRIIKTMGLKLTKLKPFSGFCAETAGAMTLFLATNLGIPVSTTHTITGAIIGVGSLSSKISAVKWGVAQRIILAWILTLPASALIGSLTFLMF